VGRLHIEPAGLAHVLAVARDLRAGDAAEIAALGVEPVAGLSRAVAQSETAYCAFFDGAPAALFGVVPYAGASPLQGSARGNAWLITTNVVDRNKVSFVRASRIALEHLMQRYEYLECLVDARYEGALRWAAALGFEIGIAGPDQVPSGFKNISIRRK
jgi:hypothetical protein